MNKHKINLSILVFVIMLLTSCWGGDNENKNPDIQVNHKTTQVDEQKVENEVEKMIDYEKDINDLKLSDIELMYLGQYNNNDNEIIKIGSNFINNLKKSASSKLTDNISGGISIAELNNNLENVPKELIKKFYIQVKPYDYLTKEKIETGTIYVNGINIGSFDNGVFKGSFDWVKGIEQFNIIVRSEQYGDGIKNINALKSKGSGLNLKVYMKKAIIKDVNLGKAQTIQAGKVKIKLNDCSMVGLDGKCYNGKATIKVNNIDGNDANQGNISTNRNAITKEGKIIQLRSGGMAYIDFIDEEGNILKLKDGESINIIYKVSKEDIERMENKLGGNGEKEGYWWYDKNDSIRKETDATFFVNKRNNTFTAQVKNLY